MGEGIEWSAEAPNYDDPVEQFNYFSYEYYNSQGDYTWQDKADDTASKTEKKTKQTKDDNKNGKAAIIATSVAIPTLIILGGIGYIWYKKRMQDFV